MEDDYRAGFLLGLDQLADSRFERYVLPAERQKLNPLIRNHLPQRLPVPDLERIVLVDAVHVSDPKAVVSAGYHWYYWEGMDDEIQKLGDYRSSQANFRDGKND